MGEIAEAIQRKARRGDGRVTPCKDCKERTEKCHAKCTRYKAWKEEHEKVRQERAKYIEGNRIDIEIKGRRKSQIEHVHGADYGYSRKTRRR